MKELKDYLHLYLGCECMYGGYGSERIVRVIGVSLKDGIQFQFQDNGEVDTDAADMYFKPILRPLSDITEKEKIECVLLFDDQFILGQDGKYAWRATFFPSMFKYLLSKYFDLFGLIEAGLAIDSKTLKEKI